MSAGAHKLVKIEKKLDTITHSNMQKAASIPKLTLNEDYNLVNYMLSINRIGYFDSDVIFTETLT